MEYLNLADSLISQLHPNMLSISTPKPKSNGGITLYAFNMHCPIDDCFIRFNQTFHEISQR